MDKKSKEIKEMNFTCLDNLIGMATFNMQCIKQGRKSNPGTSLHLESVEEQLHWTFEALKFLAEEIKRSKDNEI